MFDPGQEKIRIYELLSPMKIDDLQNSKRDKIKRAEKIAMDEYKEIAIAYNEFLNKTSHLVLFQVLKASAFDKTIETFNNTRSMIQNASFYPEDSQQYFEQDVVNKQIRNNLLEEIVRTYLSSSE